MTAQTRPIVVETLPPVKKESTKVNSMTKYALALLISKVMEEGYKYTADQLLSSANWAQTTEQISIDVQDNVTKMAPILNVMEKVGLAMTIISIVLLPLAPVVGAASQGVTGGVKAAAQTAMAAAKAAGQAAQAATGAVMGAGQLKTAQLQEQITKGQAQSELSVKNAEAAAKWMGETLDNVQNLAHTSKEAARKLVPNVKY